PPLPPLPPLPPGIRIQTHPLLADRRHHRDDEDDDDRDSRTGNREYSRAMQAHPDEDFESAIQHWKKALDAGYRPGASSYNIPCAYAQLGDANGAFEWLDKATAAGFDVYGYLDHDDDFDNIRDQPRFRDYRRKAREARVQR